MATMTLTGDNFTKVAGGSGIVLVDFWAAWCGPCRAFAPTFERVSDLHKDITFGKVDTDAEVGMAQEFQIRSIPTLMAFRDGVVIFSQAGVLPESALESLIKQIQDLDMDEVRRQIRSGAA